MQWGGNLGGPITIPKLLKSKDKVFFFVNYEYFTLPNAYSSLAVVGNSLVMTDSARTGLYTYKDSTGAIRTIDVLGLAASKGFPGTADTTITGGLGLINAAVHK